MVSRQAVLGIDHGSFSYGLRPVFTDVSLLLDDARTGLVGENGAGKSTLLRCLSGDLELNRGKLLRSRNLRVGALPQETPEDLNDLTVREVLRSALQRVGAEAEEWRIDVLLDEIGVQSQTADASFAALSGGWRRLILIAGVARLEEPDLLVLDEPTNHLDLGHIATLERWLTTQFKLPMLIVSHDRAFLNRVTERTLFLRADGIQAFKAPFSQAREELLRLDAAHARQRNLEEKEIRRLEQAAARYGLWAMKNPGLNKRKSAIETRVGHIQARRTFVYQARERRLELASAEIEAKVALRIVDLDVSTPDGARGLLRIDLFKISAGDKVALLGDNGSGKSTLLSCLAASYAARDDHYDGQGPVRFNPATRLAYFEQTMRAMPLHLSPLDYIESTPGVTHGEAVRHLAQSGFAIRRQNEPAGDFSHGERTRLAFLRMKLTSPNLYFLDEPTNHLDIDGQEALESELEKPDVSCLFVSHDRYFVRAAATRFVEIRKRRLIELEDPEAFFVAQEAGGGAS